MKKILVMGIGSHIMMDDAIGLNIVEDLRKKDPSPHVSYLVGETYSDYCLEEVLDSDYLIIIDALLSANKPGEVCTFTLKDVIAERERYICSMHGIHLFRLLQQAKHLPAGIIIGIEPYEINIGFTLSDRLQSSYPSILCKIEGLVANEIRKLMQQYNPC